MRAVLEGASPHAENELGLQRKCPTGDLVAILLRGKLVRSGQGEVAALSDKLGELLL